jgi:hypothetical protein
MAPLCYRRHRFPPEIIQHAIWLYLRFTLSYRDVEELLAERGLDISYETVRRWVLKFGPTIARRLRQRRPRPSDRRVDAVMSGRLPFVVFELLGARETVDISEVEETLAADAGPERDRKFADSLLEGAGFELSVPPDARRPRRCRLTDRYEPAPAAKAAPAAGFPATRSTRR